MKTPKIEIWWIWFEWIWKPFRYWKGIGVQGALGKIGYAIIWWR